MSAVPELTCDHEEADTRLILYACHAANAGHPVVVVDSPDTDVAALMCAHASSINSWLLFKTGTRQALRCQHHYFSQISSKLGPSFCRALPGLHTLTGRDSTSAFVGRGKMNRGLGTCVMQPPAPQAIMKFINCGCKRDCSTNQCSFMCNKMPCTDVCNCRDSCTNHVADDAAQERGTYCLVVTLGKVKLSTILLKKCETQGQTNTQIPKFMSSQPHITP